VVGARKALAAGALVASLTVVATAEPLNVVGSCREGLPNGGYELRMPDGRLRTVGAFARGKKTGTFIFWTAGGARVAVIPYDDDARTGTVALWYVETSEWIEAGRRLEARYVDDRRHGTTRSWHTNGTLRSEFRYERGALIETHAWTDTGAALPESEARELATRDAESDQALLEALVSVVSDNLPRCD
jgi:hypothetical protein